MMTDALTGMRRLAIGIGSATVAMCLGACTSTTTREPFQNSAGAAVAEFLWAGQGDDVDRLENMSAPGYVAGAEAVAGLNAKINHLDLDALQFVTGMGVTSRDWIVWVYEAEGTLVCEFFTLVSEGGCHEMMWGRFDESTLPEPSGSPSVSAR